MEHTGFPRKHIGLERKDCLKNSSWAEAYSKIQSLTGYTLAILGDRGCGKTQLAVMEAFSGRYKTARYAKAMGFFMDLKETYGNGESTNSVFTRYLNPELLVIDELHRRGSTQWENDFLENLIDCRYDRSKSTILIANLSPEAFALSVGESVVSRMGETGGIIVCDWKPFRGALRVL